MPPLNAGGIINHLLNQLSHVRVIYRIDQPNILGWLRRKFSPRKSGGFSVRICRVFKRLQLLIAMKDTVYLLIKVVIETNYKNIQDAIGDVQRNTVYTVMDSKNVKVINSKIMDLRTKRK
jgi:hypothetical protein